MLRRFESRLESQLAGMGALELGPASSGSAAWQEVARAHLHSYRQLPAIFYHFDWRVGADLHGGGGLFGTRLNRVLEVHLLAPDTRQQELLAAEMAGMVLGLVRDLRLPLWGGEYLPGAGIQAGQTWLFPHPQGDERLLQCEQCGYSAHPSAARFRRPTPLAEALAPLEPVATPDTKTIAALAGLLGIPEQRTAKAVILDCRGWAVDFAVVRGDREVNEAALRRLLGTDRCARPEEEIRAVGAEPGYASPVGLQGVRVVVDTANPPLSQSGGRRKPGGLSPVECQLRPRLTPPATWRRLPWRAPEMPARSAVEPWRSCPRRAAGGCAPLEPRITPQAWDYTLSTRTAKAARRWSRPTASTSPAPWLPGRRATWMTKACACPLAAAPFAVHLVVLAGKNPAVDETAREGRRAIACRGVGTPD